MEEQFKDESSSYAEEGTRAQRLRGVPAHGDFCSILGIVMTSILIYIR